MKREPFAHGALDRDGATVQIGEELDHGQPEARALELSRETAVDLAERLEQPLQPFGRDPMPLSVTLISRNSLELVVGQREGAARPGPDTAPTSARGTRLARRVTSPPSVVNFTAFESRL